MIFTPKKLYRGQPGTSHATLYTSTGKITIVKNILIHNPTATATYLYLCNVASGGSPAAANQFFGALVPGGDSISLDLSDVMESGDFLSGYAGAATTISVQASGMLEV